MNQNGHLILSFLKDRRNLTTTSAIISHVATKKRVRPSDIEDSIKETLDAGLRYGYIYGSRGQYYVKQVDLDHPYQSPDEDPLTGNSGRNLEDQPRVRRHSRSTSRRRR